MWAPHTNWLLGTSSCRCSSNISQRLFRGEAANCLSKDLVARAASPLSCSPLPSSSLQLQPKPTSLSLYSTACSCPDPSPEKGALKAVSSYLRSPLGLTPYPRCLIKVSLPTKHSLPPETNILVNTGYFPSQLVPGDAHAPGSLGIVALLPVSGCSSKEPAGSPDPWSLQHCGAERVSTMVMTTGSSTVKKARSATGCRESVAELPNLSV